VPSHFNRSLQLRSFLALALDGGDWSVADLRRFTAGERAVHYLTKRVLDGHQSRSGRFGGASNDDRANAYKILAGKPEGTEPLETVMS
jgi:hypothetical protein